MGGLQMTREANSVTSEANYPPPRDTGARARPAETNRLQ